MKIIRKTFNYPTTRLILWGMLKSLVAAVLASLLLAALLVNQMYGPTFDANYHFFGTSRQFFLVALIVSTVCSIPIAGITAILLSFFIRVDMMKNVVSPGRTFLVGLLLGGTLAGIGSIILTGRILDALFTAVVVAIAGVAGGLTGIWMMKDVSRLWPASTDPN